MLIQTLHIHVFTHDYTFVCDTWVRCQRLQARDSGMTEAISHLLPLYILYSSTACTLTRVPLPLHLSYQLLDFINSLQVHKTNIVAGWCVFTPLLLGLHVLNQNMYSVTELLVLLHTHCVVSLTQVLIFFIKRFNKIDII